MEGSRFLINNVPFYLKGFGKRQDSDVSPLILYVVSAVTNSLSWQQIDTPLIISNNNNNNNNNNISNQEATLPLGGLQAGPE